MRKRFLGAMLLALGIGLFGGWGSAQANSAGAYAKHAACVLAEGCSC